jgi:hypothetical protein
MAKSSKRTESPDTPPMPQVGDQVKPGRSEMVYEISRVSPDGQDVDLPFRETKQKDARARACTGRKTLAKERAVGPPRVIVIQGENCRERTKYNAIRGVKLEGFMRLRPVNSQRQARAAE